MTTTIAALAAFGIGVAIGAFLLLGNAPARHGGAVDTTGAAAPPKPVWTEVQWPFSMDEWGKGKAFRCKAADCGTDISVYVRAKIGFCNCTTGVADDEELERLTDFRLAGNQLKAVEAGKPITVAWMKGRSRAYEVSGDNRSGGSALSVAFNDRCDAIVATAVLGHDRPATLEPNVIALLNSAPVMRWAEVTLGL